MTFNHLNRRTHLYLAMFLAPWFLMYGISSYAFTHGPSLQQSFEATGQPQWTQRFERHYDVPVPEGELRPLAAQVVKDTGLQGNYGAYRQNPDQINIYVNTFWHSTQAKYFLKEQRLVVEDRTFRWDQFLTGMHARGGFVQGGLANVWGAIIDLVCIGMLLWVGTGLYMWWKISTVRGWGWLALGGGLASFLLLLWKL